MRVNLITLFCLILGNFCFAQSSELLYEPPTRNANCPLIDDPSHPILFAHPKLCNYYYACANGIAYLTICPDNLYWSNLTYRCDYAEVAKCTDTTMPQQKPITPATPIIDETIFYQPYPGDCSKFYKFYVVTCPPQSHWNARQQHCDAPEIAQCVQQATPTTPPTVNTQITTFIAPTAATPPPKTFIAPTAATQPISSNNFHEPMNSGELVQEFNYLCTNTTKQYVSHPYICHKFIQCNGFAYVHDCPSNLLWNSELSTCDRVCKKEN